MGEEFLSKQNEQFEHGRDRARAEFDQADLLTQRPEVVGESFRCVLISPDRMPTINTLLILAQMDTGLCLIDSSGQRVGTVDESDASALYDLMRFAPDCQNMLRVNVHETVELTGEFTVRVSKEESEE